MQNNDKMLKHPNTTRENKPLLHNRNLRLINNSSSTNSTSNNFFQMKKFKIKKNDNKQKVNLEIVKKNISQKLKNNLKKYDSSMRKVFIKTINDIIYDERKHIVSVFKDYLFWDENSDFLKRFYKINESRDRMPRISAYYQTYTLIKPIYFKLECYRFLSKNFKRHRKRLELLEEKLSNNKKKQQNKLHKSNEDDENSKGINNNFNNKSDEFSKIVKSHFIQNENLHETIFHKINNHNDKFNNENDLFVEIENKNINHCLIDKGKGDNMDFISYDVNNNNLNSVGKRRFIKLKDAGNKYNIEKFNLEENNNKANRNENEQDDLGSNNSNNNNNIVNSSFSFLELQNLLDLNGNTNTITNCNYPTRVLESEQQNKKNKINSNNNINNKDKNSAYVNAKAQFNNSLKRLTSCNAKKIGNNSNKLISLYDNRNNNNMKKNVVNNFASDKKEENETTQLSLLLEDYSVIKSEAKEDKSQAFSHNYYINLPRKEDNSFFTVNSSESFMSRNNEYKSEGTLDSNLEAKRTQSKKENVFILNNSKAKEKEKRISGAKAFKHSNNNNNLKKQQQQSNKDTNDNKKINIPSLNLHNINLFNSQNTLKSNAEKEQSDSKAVIKNHKVWESRKLSDSIKKENKITISKNMNIANNTNTNTYKSNTNNINTSNKQAETERKQNNNKIKETNKINNIKYEPSSNSKIERETEIDTKTNQKFKIIENMIKSIKMNNIDGLINIINSKSKGKNKALTSREKDRGDILILQNIYSRNLNKKKPNNIEEKRLYSNSNDKKALGDKFTTSNNHIENVKVKVCNSDRNVNIYNNVLERIKKVEAAPASRKNLEETYDNNLNNKQEVNTNVSQSDIKNGTRKNIVLKSSLSNSNNNKIGFNNNISRSINANINNNFFSCRNSKDANKKEIIQTKDLMTDLTVKNNLNAAAVNRNTISGATNIKKNIIGLNNNNTNNTNTYNTNKIQMRNSNNSNKNNNFNRNVNYNNSNNPASSVYNINLNLNLNLNLKMDKVKSSEINETRNSNCKDTQQNIILQSNTSRKISASNNHTIKNYSSNILNKDNRIIIKKASEDAIYKNIIQDRNQQEKDDLIAFKQSALTDRHLKDHFDLEELKLKSNFNDGENESRHYVNTDGDNNINNMDSNYERKSSKVCFVNKILSTMTENIPETKKKLNNNNNNILYNSQDFENKFIIPHNLSRNVYNNTNNQKLKLKAEENNRDLKANSNMEIPINNNSNNTHNDNGNYNCGGNYNSNNFSRKLIEEDKKSRNVQNNNLANENLFVNNNLNNNGKNNNGNSTSDKYKNTFNSKQRITQPLTQRILEGVSKNINYLHNNMQMDSTKHVNLENKVVYKSEKSRIIKPLLYSNSNNINNINSNLNANNQNNLHNSSRNNNNNTYKNSTENISLKLPSSSRNIINKINNNTKINLNNLVKNVNLNYNTEKGSNVKNLIEKETKTNIINSNSNLFSSIEGNSSRNNNNNININKINPKGKLDSNKQNYESINSYQNNNFISDASLKSSNLINDESYLRIFKSNEKKFHLISRNFNLKNLIFFNETTKINKDYNPISLHQTDTYAKNNYGSNTARNYSASKNLYYDNKFANNKNDFSALFKNSKNNNYSNSNNKNNLNIDLSCNNNGNKQNYISLEKSKINDLNFRNDLQQKDKRANTNSASQNKPCITNYNDKSSPVPNEKTPSILKKTNFNNDNYYDNNDSDFKKTFNNKNEAENHPMIKNLKEVNLLLASVDFSNKTKNDANNLINNYTYNNNNKQKIKIPILNLKDINKQMNEEYQEVVEPKGNLTSARNNKNIINDFFKKNVNTAAVNPKEYFTSRNDKNHESNKNDLINLDLNPKKGN